MTHDTKKEGEEVEQWQSMVPHPNFDQYMRPYRFKEFRRFLPEAWVDFDLKESNDPWWQFQAAVTEFNNLRSETIRAHCWKVADESMSAYRPRTTKLGDLPNISFVMRKPEPLGKSFAIWIFALHYC